ncbi:MAG: alpha/beta hydrolase [Acidobacteria bacterium]|nr:alpha/beta hydrolase [Acidobacteriota bacterium]
MASEYQGRLRVIYPLERGRIVLRTEQDWQKNLEPVAVAPDGCCHEFEVRHVRHHLAYKPCIVDGDRLTWSEGTNKLWILDLNGVQDVYPHFHSGLAGRLSEILELPSALLGRSHRMRVYLPAGYDENFQKAFPVLYVHDGQNLFFPDEAFFGTEWRLDETLDLLDAMNLIDRVIVVGLYSDERETDYTQPGYELYARSLVEEVRPFIGGRYRVLGDRRHTGILGASLGGVVSLYAGWQWPEVFGNVGCMSSTFGYRDDLLDRVHDDPVEPRRHLKLYLDSGWPNDNYDVTFSMATALVERGFAYGRDLVHFAFPRLRHEESAWGGRVHLPLQLFSGKIRRFAALYQKH